MIRITQICEGSERRLVVEGTLSDGWVDALETAWSEAEAQSGDEPVRVHLSGITYVDDKGRNLLAHMIRRGAALLANGILASAIIEEITQEAGKRATKTNRKEK